MPLPVMSFDPASWSCRHMQCAAIRSQAATLDTSTGRGTPCMPADRSGGEAPWARMARRYRCFAIMYALFLFAIPPALANESVFNSSFGTEVLPASKFSGKSARGYALAKQIPQVCCKLFCYCGCDCTDAHTSLLDCFTTVHGDACPICQEEVIAAYKLKKEGKTIAAIQKTIDATFSGEYPFKYPSPAYDNYRKSVGLPSLNSGSNATATSKEPSNSSMPELKDDFLNRPKKHKPIKCCKHTDE